MWDLRKKFLTDTIPEVEKTIWLIQIKLFLIRNDKITPHFPHGNVFFGKLSLLWTTVRDGRDINFPKWTFFFHLYKTSVWALHFKFISQLISVHVCFLEQALLIFILFTRWKTEDSLPVWFCSLHLPGFFKKIIHNRSRSMQHYRNLMYSKSWTFKSSHFPFLKI